jgi:glutamate synthase domain-containing protein 1
MDAMEKTWFIKRPYPHEKDISSCGVIGLINTDGRRVPGGPLRDAMANMHDRGNGLGGGFAAYGIYPGWHDHYCLHVMYEDQGRVSSVEAFLYGRLRVDHVEEIRVAPNRKIRRHPYFRRYFIAPPSADEPEADGFVADAVMEINQADNGAFVISSGKNMGVFKGVGFPEDIYDFFRMDQYEACIWTAHNRFPTNTPGWWGGAHPFSLLDWSIVHNGEISSYGINKRYLEMFGYVCTLQTDTEVVAYLLDLLVRRHGLSFEQAAAVLAPPLWKDIDAMPEPKRQEYTRMRMVYGSAALNGPFAFLLAYSGGLIGLNDRVKLRPLVVARNGATWYMSSEESAIRVIAPAVDELFAPPAGKPFIVELEKTAAAVG